MNLRPIGDSDSKPETVRSQNSIISPPHFDIYSNRRIIADGNFEIIGYSGEKVMLKCRDSVFSFFGTDIEIESFTDESAEISGLFTKIEFS
ncbi:MAG: YabP/YqfC family sporulation protein [Acutalibacteraceae bacterium]